MAKFGEDPSSLFRSLRPDDAKFQAGTAAAAREAEMRWPLFKTISPKRPEPTPALSADERRHWSNPERPIAEERKPALSLPGVSSKLAKSLSRMAPRQTPVAPEKPLPQTGRRKPVGEPARSSLDVPLSAPDRVSAGLFSRPPAAKQVEEVQEYDEEPIRAVATHVVSTKAEIPAMISADNSLAGVFRRLEKQEEDKVVAKPARRKSSFLGRIGKR